MKHNITLRENNSTVPQTFHDVDTDFVNYIWNKHSVDEPPTELFSGEPINCGNDHVIIVEVLE